MWRVVDNWLSLRSHVAKLRPPRVENECGQMCTEPREESAARTDAHSEFSTEKPREFTGNRVKNSRRETRYRVTSRGDCHDDSRVEKTRPIHIAVWTDC